VAQRHLAVAKNAPMLPKANASSGIDKLN